MKHRYGAVGKILLDGLSRFNNTYLKAFKNQKWDHIREVNEESI